LKLTSNCSAGRGVRRLDGARGKKQVWRPFSNLGPFGSKCAVEESTSDILGTFRRPHSDLAPWESSPLAPLVKPLECRTRVRIVHLNHLQFKTVVASLWPMWLFIVARGQK